MKQMIENLLYFPSKVRTFINFKRKHVQVGIAVETHGTIHIHGNSTIILGNHVVLNSGSHFNPSSGEGELHLSAWDQGILEIGNHTGISNSSITAHVHVTIGAHVWIGSGCMITDTDFHSIEPEYRLQKPDTHISKAPVKIGNGAFLGARTIVLKGVAIGENAVVGAGSVVVSDIPAGEIWAGNPAHFLKKVPHPG